MKTKFKYLLGAGLSLLVTLGFTQGAAAQTDTRIVYYAPVTVGDSSQRGKPIYTTYDQIFVMNADGTNPQQLTDAAADSYFPAWSPDKRYISFNRSGTVYVMEATGEANGGQIFAVAPALGEGSDWSPDGKSLCYVSPSSRLVPPALWIADVDVATGTVGTPTRVWEGDCSAPKFSPDGTKIAFNSNIGGPPADYGYTAEIVKVLDLTTGNVNSFDSMPGLCPSWNPDGSQIAFCGTVTVTTTKGHKTTTNNYIELFVMNADFSGVTQITSFNSLVYWPTWSPDGTQVAFRSDFSGTPSIYEMTLGSPDVTLIQEDADAPDWTP